MENTYSEKILDSFLKTPELRGVFVSPNGKWVAWSWTNIGSNIDVYISKADGSGKPKKLTDFNQKTRIVSWAANSCSLIVSHDYDGDERFRLYQIDIETLKITPLTDDHPNYFIRGGQLHPNEHFLVYGANYDFENNKEIESTYIYRHDLISGEKVVLVKPEKPAFVYPKLNTQGTQILYNRSDLDPSGEQIWLVDIDGKNDAEILNFGSNLKISASWHPNGKEVVFVAEEKTYRRVGLFNTESKTIRWVLDDPTRNIENAYIPQLGNKIVIIEVIKARTEVSLIDLDTFTELRLSNDLHFIPLAPVSDVLWVGESGNSRQPEGLIVCDLSSSKIVSKIIDIFEYLDYRSDTLVEAENYEWFSSDGLVIQGWLYQPKIGKAKGTVVLVHGGPTWHKDDSFDIDDQFFVSQGFNVFIPNYRGSTGFGLEFQNSIKKDGWGGREQDDILTGIKSLIKDGIAEIGKVGISGTSYGGYSSWFAITHFPVEYTIASAPICGMTDLVVDYETTRPDLRSYSEEMMGGSPTQVPEIYYDRSPINFIKNIKGKLLIIQGAQDPNVSPQNVEEAEKELKKHKIFYEKLVFADEGHGISKPKNQKILLMRLLHFFDESFASGNMN